MHNQFKVIGAKTCTNYTNTNCNQACDFSVCLFVCFCWELRIVENCVEMMPHLGGWHRDSRNVQVWQIYLLYNIFLALGISFSGDLDGVETKVSVMSQLWWSLQDTLYEVLTQTQSHASCKCCKICFCHFSFKLISDRYQYFF